MYLLPLFWLLFAIAAAIAARAKNRSGFLYFLLAFLIGPFSLLFVVLTAPKPKTTAPPPPAYALPAEPPEPTKTCPACAETVKLAALKCKHCGEALDPQEAQRLQEEYETYQSTLGAAIAAGTICPACHGELTTAFMGDGSYGPWCPACQKPVAPK
jgi:hypothetical protein